MWPEGQPPGKGADSRMAQATLRHSWMLAAIAFLTLSLPRIPSQWDCATVEHLRSPPARAGFLIASSLSSAWCGLGQPDSIGSRPMASAHHAYCDFADGAPGFALPMRFRNSFERIDVTRDGLNFALFDPLP